VGLHVCQKGLDLPLPDPPVQEVGAGPPISHVGVLGDDFPGATLRSLVEVGRRVRRGDPLCIDRANPDVRFVAPGAGTIAAVHLGERRAVRSIVIELTDSEHDLDPTAEDFATFASYSSKALDRWDPADIRALLVESGLWAAIRGRPFGKVPPPDEVPAAAFITAIDTNPHAPDPDVVLALDPGAFDRGLSLIGKLTAGPTYLCVRSGSRVPSRVSAPVSVEEFSGPHPAGTAGFHIHRLVPVGRERTVWTVGYQDVLATGRLFQTGRLPVERIVALSGGGIQRPRLVRTRLGASTAELLAEEDHADDVRRISGSIWSGKAATGEVFGYMGRHDLQITLVPEDRNRTFLQWLRPGSRTFSVLPVQWSSVHRRPRYEFSTSSNGARRPIVPIGAYERIMPFDILPTFLLRALTAEDDETAERLGALELIEEDLALASFVDPGKADFGPTLRRALERMAAER
jgi:Na+-transporting NADH:ubiquinone oxidoreductase subunit A